MIAMCYLYYRRLYVTHTTTCCLKMRHNAVQRMFDGGDSISRQCHVVLSILIISNVSAVSFENDFKSLRRTYGN